MLDIVQFKSINVRQTINFKNKKCIETYKSVNLRILLKSRNCSKLIEITNRVNQSIYITNI